MQPGLFDTPICDHLPVGQRTFVDGALVCGRCGKVLRTKEGKDLSLEK